jgi:hypothetical protein
MVEAAAAADAALTPAETLADIPSPAPAEAPAVPAEGPAPAVVETPPASEVPARDAHGRFTKPDGTLSEPGEQETPPSPAVETDLSTYAPFSFRADGQVVEYAGAVQDDDGNVLFTPAAVQHLKQDLAYGRAYPRRDADAQRDLSRERSARQSAEATTQSVLSKLDQLFEQSQGATTLEELIQTPLGQWVLARHAEWPKLRAEGLQKGFEVKSRTMEAELQQFRGREQDAQQQPVMLGRVEEAIQHWGKEAGFDLATQQALYRRFTASGQLDRIFPRATQDDPVSGRRAGQRTENLDVIREEMLVLHGILKGRTAGPSAEALKAENARRLGQAGVKPPPMAGVGRGTAPAGGKKPTYKTTQEADAEIWR